MPKRVWSDAQREKFLATAAAKREANPPRKTRRRTGTIYDYPWCGVTMPSGNACRLPKDHPDQTQHRERIKGEYALALVRAITGVDLAQPAIAERPVPIAVETRVAVATSTPLPVARVAPEPQPVAPEPVMIEGATLEASVARLAEAVTAMRWTLLSIEGTVKLLAQGAGLRPTAQPLQRDPALVDAMRTLHARLKELERRNVTSGDWEEGLEEILQLVRGMDRKLTKWAPQERKRRAPA